MFHVYVPHYSDFTSLIYYIQVEKIGVYAWNFCDTFVIILCRAVSHKFREINEEVVQIILEGNQTQMEKEAKKGKEQLHPYPEPHHPYFVHTQTCYETNQITTQSTSWKDIREKILAMCSLTDEVSTFIAPLLQTCYWTNIFLIIFHVRLAIQKLDFPTTAKLN